jgi:hypothetical protein
MRELLGLCIEGDHDAWRRLWEIAAASVRRAMPRRRIGLAEDASLVDDAEQEFYLFLREDSCRRLRAFRGGGEPEFRGYLRVVAGNFLHSRRASRRRAEAREHGTRLAAARPEAGGPTEPQVLAALREFLATTSAEERGRLEAILVPEGRPEADRVGSRTLRRWRRELAAVYTDRVL